MWLSWEIFYEDIQYTNINKQCQDLIAIELYLFKTSWRNFNFTKVLWIQFFKEPNRNPYCFIIFNLLFNYLFTLFSCLQNTLHSEFFNSASYHFLLSTICTFTSTDLRVATHFSCKVQKLFCIANQHSLGKGIDKLNILIYWITFRFYKTFWIHITYNLILLPSLADLLAC